MIEGVQLGSGLGIQANPRKASIKSWKNWANGKHDGKKRDNVIANFFMCSLRPWHMRNGLYWRKKETANGWKLSFSKNSRLAWERGREPERNWTVQFNRNKSGRSCGIMWFHVTSCGHHVASRTFHTYWECSTWFGFMLLRDTSSSSSGSSRTTTSSSTQAMPDAQRSCSRVAPREACTPLHILGINV